ncbi:unnamed protein product [Cyclocybe aegerita]|uniref:NAD(P)-binding protein n=1 Tax=Cyclocybe aegerita TaxID=1973307 RepID=A0A8S0WWY0_CYCAE|nr:unnamed protein product [Cyclocybe aegerita]
MATTKVYIVTNADRGVGSALVEVLARKHEDIVIYAGVCSPSNATELKGLASQFPGKIEIAEVATGDENTNETLAETIQEKHGYVDVAIYNAGITNDVASANDVSPNVFREHLEGNAITVLVLYQAMSALLKESKSKPKFIAVSTEAAHTNEDMVGSFDYGAYSASKATLNYICRKIHYENSWLVALPIAPGAIKNAPEKDIPDELFITAEASAAAIVKIVDYATREKEGGQFMRYDGMRLDW